ncbi:MAG: MOSC domain-containing protein [Bacteroidota bacterium]
MLNTQQLEAGLDYIRKSPKNSGTLDLIVIRPEEGERQILTTGELCTENGLKGDNWHTRGSRHTPDGSAEPDKMINIMNARSIELIAESRDRWPLAGDQLYIDLDLSTENLPTGSQIQIGTAILEVTPPPHNGCKKFVERFGLDAMKFVNSTIGKTLHLRGINAKVVQAGTIKTGDTVTKV